jgi:hypothetical protein
MISYWTDPTEFVTWELQVPRGGNYFVEIRYACPQESSGTRYCVRVEGAGKLEGRVWTTGGRTSLTPWLPLGKLCIPSGRSTLSVRALQKASDSVMNLSAVQLTPTEWTG